METGCVATLTARPGINYGKAGVIRCCSRARVARLRGFLAVSAFAGNQPGRRKCLGIRRAAPELIFGHLTQKRRFGYDLSQKKL